MTNIPKSILLVEDEITTARITTKLLESKGYKLTHAATGKAALVIIISESITIDLILMDIQLGTGMDGTVAAQKILKISDIPIIFLSANSDPEIIKKIEQISSYDFVVKGSGLAILVASIKISFKLFDTKKELIKSQQLLQESQTIAKIGSWSLDLNTQQVACSDMAFILLDQDPVAYSLSLEAFNKCVHPDDFDTMLANYNSAIESKDKQYHVIIRMINESGREWVMESLGKVQRDSQSNAISVTGTMQDISVAQKTEEALRRSQKMDAIGKLTGDIAHDFNNILSIILGNLHLLKKKVTNDEKIYKRINTIKKSAERASALTSQLLSFSRKKATNARDAMDRNGTLTLSTSNYHYRKDSQVKHPDLKIGEYVLLSVSDTGHGIPANELERIFEPFYTTKSKDKGTGLGLAMVFGFVERSNGFIEVLSEVEKGTTFNVYLPRSIKEIQEKSIEIGDNLYFGKETLFTDIIMPGGKNSFELTHLAHKFSPKLKAIFTSGYTETSSPYEDQKIIEANILKKPYTQVAMLKLI